MGNMNKMIITPHFCETMYIHYDERLQQKNMHPKKRQVLQEQQEYYRKMHAVLVPFTQVCNLFEPNPNNQ